MAPETRAEKAAHRLVAPVEQREVVLAPEVAARVQAAVAARAEAALAVAALVQEERTEEVEAPARVVQLGWGEQPEAMEGAQAAREWQAPARVAAAVK